MNNNQEEDYIHKEEHEFDDENNNHDNDPLSLASKMSPPIYIKNKNSLISNLNATAYRL
jgi:hypothetical protein